MTSEQVERMVAQGKDIPNTAPLYAVALYHALKGLITEYRLGAVTKAQASKHKVKMLQLFKAAEIDAKVLKKHRTIQHDISLIISEMTKNECLTCRKAAAIWAGRSETK